MEALVLERKGELRLRDIAVDESLGPNDVRIRLEAVGICGSDLHYYLHGSIGPFVVTEPMILGHEASGTVVEIGSQVHDLAPGDRVCMEPGIPDLASRASRLGIYNLDPAVRFWATPPVHGVTRPTVVHPAYLTFKLPSGVTFAEGAMVEPLAVGMHAASRAEIAPGDTAVVVGAGTIGLVTILAALAGGCSRVIVTDVKEARLAIATTLGPVTAVNVAKEDAILAVKRETAGWGADIVFEASGEARVWNNLFQLVRPGGRVVAIGMPAGPVGFDIVAAQAREATVKTIFRYAHVFDRAVALLGSGKINLRPLITETFSFRESVAAYQYAASPKPESVKVQITLAS